MPRQEPKKTKAVLDYNSNNTVVRLAKEVIPIEGISAREARGTPGCIPTASLIELSHHQG